MEGLKIRRRSGIATLTLIFLTSAMAATNEPSGGLVAWVKGPELVDGIAPEQLAEIRAAVAAYKGTGTARALEDEEPFLYPFFPQAGVLGRDLFLSNFTDQDPNPNSIRDWDCSDYTYDGHHGHDSLIRSFREQAIGVPVFAVLDGVVVETHDGEPDMNTVADLQARANYVAIDHGGGYTVYYLHFKRDSVAVVPGQTVRAGTQIGLTGSSGFSNWPHLHMETHQDGRWLEPSAGPCRGGDSFWVAQPPVVRDFYVADFYLARGEISIPDAISFFLDETERTATFLKGAQTLGMRADLRNLLANSTYELRVLTPRNQVVFGGGGPFGNSTFERLSLGLFAFDLNLDVAGIWRLQVEINDALVLNVPFRVVANARLLKNRPPSRVTARLRPSKPVEGQVLTCEVQTSLITEDPDFDIVSYRYEWRVNNRVVRSVNSAALTDLLPAGAAKPKDRVSCRVVPADAKSAGKAAVALATIAER